jgi:toxin ParE1/3/4
LILRIVWSSDANRDLAQIWNYLAQEASVARADDQVRKIEAACRVLSEWPLAGQSRDAIIPGLRAVVAAPYVVFYRVSSPAVQIIRVLDGRRDVDTILADTP